MQVQYKKIFFPLPLSFPSEKKGKEKEVPKTASLFSSPHHPQLPIHKKEEKEEKKPVPHGTASLLLRSTTWGKKKRKKKKGEKGRWKKARLSAGALGSSCSGQLGKKKKKEGENEDIAYDLSDGFPSPGPHWKEGKTGRGGGEVPASHHP